MLRQSVTNPRARSAIQPIADSAHGFDVGRPSAELTAERNEHHVDEPVRDVLGLGLDGVEYGRAGVDAVRTGKEQLKHPVFTGRERKPLATQSYDMGFRREGKSVAGERSGSASGGGSQDGADSSPPMR